MGGEYVGVTPAGQRPWGHTTLTVRLAIMTFGSSVQREGESSEEWTRVTERDHIYSKRLNSFLFLKLFRFCFKYMQNSVGI